MSEDLEEFEDAVDFEKSCEVGTGVSSFAESSLAASRRDRLTALRRRMREEFGARDLGLTYGVTSDCDTLSVASEATSLHSWHRRVLASSHTMESSLAASRRDRLTALRRRMREEFGARDLGLAYGVTSDCDTLSVASEATSLHSWHRRVLASSHTMVVHPSDSMSTRAGPSYPIPPSTSLSQVYAQPEPIMECDPLTISLSHPSVSPASLPSSSLTSPTGPPPSHPPPPLPPRELTRQAGPFPPPSNKSNSLTRQELDDDGEECARNTAAEGVILQITTKIIGDQSVRSRDGDLEPIASESSSISSPSSEMSRKMKEMKSTKAKTLQEQSVDEAVETIEKEVSVDVAEKPENGDGGDELTVADGASLEISLSSSIDPITRDVERRMSMKRDCPLNSETMGDEVRMERFPSSRSSFDHAKTWARSYGSYATGLFRGAFQRMKSAAHGNASVKVDETSDSEGEQSESGLQSAGHNGSIVRPRKGKKGPFDFENLRVVQELNNEHTGAVWCVRFSVCGRLMATAGQDNIIRVWAARSEINGDEEDSTNLFSAKPFVVFKDDRYFLSGSLDGKLRMWHIPDKKVAVWNEVPAIRDDAAAELFNMPKTAHPRRILNMCMFTARQRGKIKPYRVNRHLFRKLADHSKLSGVQRAMW
ncbi:ribosomal protein S14p/S29e [Teladorsagia circumcincta]|uniref:WD repeat-containing protein 44 n=1 Tax=Teladorsagia circumcincta TaxID=45464 RepID=A0A2G9U7W5_TELCI|nr:ribosomal protein S14p/S29e [Teladorsagia circumcincta]